MKLKQIQISDITHEDERFREDMGDMSELIESMKEKGVLQPITITTKNRLVAGARRVAAAREIGLETIPAIVRNVFDEVDLREIELIENIARKDFNWVERAKLERYIYDLKKEKDPEWNQKKQAKYLKGSEAAVSRRLALAEAIDIIPELEDCKNQDEAWKKYNDVKEAIITRQIIDQADVKHRDAAKYAKEHYKIGDFFEGIIEVADGSMNFAEVDPPYAIQLKKRKSRNVKDTTDNYNEIEEEEYPEFLLWATDHIYRVLRNDTFCVWWFAPDWYNQVLDALKDVGFKVSTIPAIWVKGISGQTASPDTTLGSSYETFFVCRKGEPKLRKPGRSNVFSYKQVPPSEKIHPTARPLDLMDEIINTFCYPGSIMIVPFLGSGVTLRAAYKNNMVGFGWDLDKLTQARFVNAVYEDSVAIDDKENEE